jgi:hypothetical protein
MRAKRNTLLSQRASTAANETAAHTPLLRLSIGLSHEPDRPKRNWQYVLARDFC